MSGYQVVLLGEADGAEAGRGSSAHGACHAEACPLLDRLL